MPIAAARTVADRIREGVRVPLPLRVARRSRQAATALAVLAGCVLLAPAAAEAQSYNVSNLGQTLIGTWATRSCLYTSFTTGGTISDRFAVASVVVKVGNYARDTLVGIYTDSGGLLGTQVGSSMFNAGGGRSGDITFTANAGDIMLEGATKYHLRMSHRNGAGTNPVTGRYNFLGVRRTTSNTEDTGSTTGWSIGNVHEK